METYMQKVFSEIDKLQDKYVKLLVDICNIESKSENKKGVDKVGEYLRKVAEDLGYTIKQRNFEKAGNVYSFTLNPDGEKKMISLSGHMDTVFEEGVFGYPPTKIEGDRIYGPGVIDCKGGIAIAMLVLEALKNCGYTQRPVKLILQSDEEVNSSVSDKKSIEFMVDEAKESAMFLNCEGHLEGHVTVGRKGIVKRKISIKGKAHHAAGCTNGISAVKEAAHKIIEFEKGNDKAGITFNCGIINGGSVINIVPDNCEVQMEYRFKTIEQQNEAEEKFKRIVETSYVEGSETVWETLSHRICMERNEASENLAKFVSEMSVKYGYEEQKMREVAGGGDACYTASAGIPSLDGMGIEGGSGHTVNEWALLPSIPKMAKILSSIIVEFPE